MHFKVLIAISVLINVINGHPLDAPLDQAFAPHILGGVEAAEGRAPYAAALVTGWGISHLMCGASIVTPHHIMTAAHCIEPMVVWGVLLDTFRAVIGSNAWTKPLAEVYFSDFILHPEYDNRVVKNDVGILYLREELQLGPRVQPVALGLDFVKEANCYVTGWGLMDWNGWLIAEQLQILYLKCIGPEECIQRMDEATGSLSPPPIDGEVEICTLHKIGHGTCYGDSGSALVSVETGQQVGIVSWGLPCALGAPDVYARVSSARNFLCPILKTADCEYVNFVNDLLTFL